MIRAPVVAPSAPNGVALTHVPAPTGPVVVDVQHVSLNLGDLNDARSGRIPVGGVLGSDVAGIVVQTSPDGPPIGTRVVALTSGAFAEQVVVDPNALAVVPADVDLAHASALPVAGLCDGRPREVPDVLPDRHHEGRPGPGRAGDPPGQGPPPGEGQLARPRRESRIRT
jgi:NADPH2:quinone reductase